LSAPPFLAMNRLLRSLLCTAAFVSVVNSSYAASSATQPDDSATGVAILFSGTQSTLGEADKTTIYNELGFHASSNGYSLEAPSCGPVNVNTQIVDLDGKGSQDVIVLGGSLCTSGVTGASAWLFIKDKAGRYQKSLGFPATGANVMGTTHGGYHDLAFTGPGECISMWRWKGHRYQFDKSQTQTGQACPPNGLHG
jgi:hypothetical protein